METETRAAMVGEFILRRWGNQMQYSELTRIPVMHSCPCVAMFPITDCDQSVYGTHAHYLLLAMLFSLHKFLGK